MSYKVDLSGLDRDGIDHRAARRALQARDRRGRARSGREAASDPRARRRGRCQPPDRRPRLPQARRARLRDRVRRPRHVRARARPEASEEFGDDWQVYALPQHDVTYPERVLADAFASAGDPELISLALGWPSPRLYPRRARPDHGPGLRGGGRRGAFVPARGGPLLVPRAAGAARAQVRLGPGRRRDRGRVGREAGSQPRRPGHPRGGRRGGDRVTHVRRHARVAAQHGARVIGVPVDEDGLDVDALERQLARHEVKLVALQTACQNPTGRNLSEERRRRLAQLAVERNFFIIEDRVYADTSFEGDAPRPLRELAPAHVIYVNSLSKVVGGGLRAGWVAARGPVRDRLAMLKLGDDFHSPTLIQHIAARWLAAGAHDRYVEHTPVLPRAPRRPRRGARASPGGRVPRRHPERRPPPLGDADAAARRAQPLLRGGAPRRGVHARRRRDRRAAVAGLAAPLLLAAGAARARRGRAPARAGDSRGAPQVAARGRGADVLGEAAEPTSTRSQSPPSSRSSSREKRLRNSRRTPSRWVRRASLNASRPAGVIWAK